jgi:hypothetical protein
MAQPEAVKPAANRRAMNRDAMDPRQLPAQLIQRQIAPLGQARANPTFKRPQLPGPPQITLTLRRKPPGLPAQLDHVIHEVRRNPKMTRRLAVPMAFVDKGDDPRP